MKFQALHESNALAAISRMIRESAGQNPGKVLADKSFGKDAAPGGTKRRRQEEQLATEQSPKVAEAGPGGQQSESKSQMQTASKKKPAKEEAKPQAVGGKPDEHLQSHSRQNVPSMHKMEQTVQQFETPVREPRGSGIPDRSSEAEKRPPSTQQNNQPATLNAAGTRSQKLNSAADKGEREPRTETLHHQTFRDWYMNSYIDAFAPDLAAIQEQEGKGARVDMLRMCAEDVVDMFREVEKSVAMHGLGN